MKETTLRSSRGNTPDEDHGHGVQLAVAEQGFLQSLGTFSIAELEFRIGCESGATVSDRLVQLLDGIETFQFLRRYLQEGGNRVQMLIRILYLSIRAEADPRLGRVRDIFAFDIGPIDGMGILLLDATCHSQGH